LADRVSGNPQDHQPKRELLLWLLLVPLAFLILFGCGQLALNGITRQTAPDTRSKLQADYRAWPMALIPAINPAIIEDIRRDENLNSTVMLQPVLAHTPSADRHATAHVDRAATHGHTRPASAHTDTRQHSNGDGTADTHNYAASHAYTLANRNVDLVAYANGYPVADVNRHAVAHGHAQTTSTGHGNPDISA
jgi:hypothetical protein